MSKTKDTQETSPAVHATPELGKQYGAIGIGAVAAALTLTEKDKADSRRSEIRQELIERYADSVAV